MALSRVSMFSRIWMTRGIVSRNKKAYTSNGNKTTQDRSGAFKRWFSPRVPIRCAIACAEDMPLHMRRRSPTEARHYFMCTGYLHPARRLEREVNQSAPRFYRRRLLNVDELLIQFIRQRAGRCFKLWAYCSTCFCRLQPSPN